jgi:dTDP-4-amino-4,6-dideoxy-D-galactose acyltransferase
VTENYRIRDGSDVLLPPHDAPWRRARRPGARAATRHAALAFSTPGLAPVPVSSRASLRGKSLRIGQAGPILDILDWDSRHFGFPVARIIAPDLDDVALAKVLGAARRKAAVLVYWATRSERPVSELLLREFSGTRVDRKATFVAKLPLVVPMPRGADPASFRLWEYPRGPACEQLVTLAIGAGVLSRFNVDPWFPKNKFESLYRTWIERSVLGELADAVWVASRLGDDDALVGMVTVSVSGATGQIGLISVLDSARGRGVGRLLMEKAHHWLIGQSAIRATVVTQLANQPACRLYEQVGYTLHDVERWYHFWPQNGCLN